MRLTKFGHACLLVEKEGRSLVVDPGVFSGDLPVKYYDLVVITHIHPDHVDIELLKKLIAENKDLKVFSIKDVKNMLATENIDCNEVEASSKAEESGFVLEFYGGQHGISHELWPKFANLGVFVDKTLYYPGDSFVAPETTIPWLAVPVSGPWMKTGEAMDFILRTKPKNCFPTHESLMSEDGKNFSHGYMKFACEKSGSQYVQIENANSMELV